VIFDRGRDIRRYYEDPDVRTFAQRHDLALLFPFHCRAKSYQDMNVDPAKGLGRVLFAALDELAHVGGHSELTSVPLILLGFSGTGALVGRLAEFRPVRIAAVIASDPGHFDPLGVDTITLSPEAAAIPELILAGSADAISGTTRPYAYFRKYFDRGAPWTFIVQNTTPHCCIINAKALILQWLNAVVVTRLTRPPKAGWYGFIRTAWSKAETCPHPRPMPVPPGCLGARDTWGAQNWRVTAAAIARRLAPRDNAMIPAGWMPTRAFANAWLTFVRQPTHPSDSLP
jgi:hypothetical protein